MVTTAESRESTVAMTDQDLAAARRVARATMAARVARVARVAEAVIRRHWVVTALGASMVVVGVLRSVAVRAVAAAVAGMEVQESMLA